MATVEAVPDMAALTLLPGHDIPEVFRGEALAEVLVGVDDSEAPGAVSAAGNSCRSSL